MKTNGKTEKQISLQIEGGGGQRTTYREVLAVGAHKLLVIIHTDSYPEQCSVHVDRWDGDGWREVHRLLPASMKTPHDLGYKRRDRKPSAADYANDRAELLRVALEVLGGES